jgi:hypothetical protein
MFTPGTKEFGDAARALTELVAKAVDALVEAAVLTAPGNVADTQVKEDYGKYASAERLCGKEPKDRCTWLDENKSKYRADQVKATQKAWGCRGSRAQK